MPTHLDPYLYENEYRYKNDKKHISQPFAVMHICKPHKPTHRPKLAKEHVYPNAEENSKYFFLALLKNKKPDTQTNSTKPVKLNNDNGLQTRWTRTPAGNMRLASCGGKCLNSSSVFQINFSAGLTVLCPEIPHERQAQKR